MFSAVAFVVWRAGWGRHCSPRSPAGSPRASSSAAGSSIRRPDLQRARRLLLHLPGRVVPVIVLGEAMRAAQRRLEQQQEELSTTNLALESKVEAQSLLAAIVASSDDAIISKTLEGVITSWNKGAEHLFGWTRRGGDRQVDPPDRAAGAARQERADPRSHPPRRARRAARRRAHAQGRLARAHVSVTVSPVHDRHGHIIGASKTARDITTRKAWEDSLVRSEEAQRLLVGIHDATRGLSGSRAGDARDRHARRACTST